MNLQTLTKITYGLYIVSSKKGDKFNGQIANCLTQITAEPVAIAVTVNKKNLTHEYIQASKVFTISILSQAATLPFIGQFGFKSGRTIDKFKDVKYKVGITKAPVVLDNSVGYIECELNNSVDVGTHTIFIGKAVGAEMINDAEPMTYDYYHKVIKGKTAKNAPTYIKEEKTSIKEEIKGEKMSIAKYRCTVCNYIYDPEKADPDSGIKPGTPFEELPADWVCPVCGAGKDKFVKEEKL
jgi:flavin reductase (DIM6/NTAB) family NADH-FMN oxidoreductase RutF/rubredoxin